MTTTPLVFDKRSHLPKVVKDLLSCGWSIETTPLDGRIPRNGLKTILDAESEEIKLRVFAYKISKSGRDRPHERRVEITSTYFKGLSQARGFKDVVVGVDQDTGKYVGVDPRRLKIGGPTGNASSFFDPEGLAVKSGAMLISPRRASHPIFPTGIEHHAFFDLSRLPEYLFNHNEIHGGTYAFGGSFAGPCKTSDTPLPSVVDADLAEGDILNLSSHVEISKPSAFAPGIIVAAEEQDFAKLNRAGITPEQLKKILLVCEEVGALGEQAVLDAERKRLRRLGFRDQARQVQRISLQSVGEGYDILSFENDGVTKRYLEVKATIGASPIVDISRGEWEAAQKHGRHYYLVRVTHAKDAPSLHYIRDPASLESKSVISRTATGWRVDLGKVLKSRK